MLCQRCQKNQAEYYYKQNVNGKVTEVALCRACASEKEKDFFSGKSFFSEDAMNLLGGFFGFPAASALHGARAMACPGCGATLSDLRATGMTGCARCYQTFSRELLESIRSIHGSVTHKGRRPNSADKTAKEKTEDTPTASAVKTADKTADAIEQMRAELEAAVRAEEYEKAAALRDAIHAAQEKKNGGRPSGNA